MSLGLSPVCALRQEFQKMILIGLGGNLPSPRFGPPPATLEAALTELSATGIGIVRRSAWYRSAPVPAGDQPWYTNGVAELATRLPPRRLLARLLAIERHLGRTRTGTNRWAPRIIDLDLLAVGDTNTWGAAATIANTSDVAATSAPALPHPRLHERAFVLVPLAEIAPGWRHPVFGCTVEELIRDLPPGQYVAPLVESVVAGRRGSVAAPRPVR
jgi:2-amino-4-hydroxy-6-hydroxymethyldihydropteridine diphosphokinase